MKTSSKNKLAALYGLQPLRTDHDTGEGDVAASVMCVEVPPE